MKKMMSIIILAAVAMLSGACSTETIDRTGTAYLTVSGNYETSPECKQALRADDEATDRWFNAPTEGEESDSAWEELTETNNLVNDLGCSRLMWERYGK